QQTFNTVIGPIRFDANDNQADMGLWVGRTGFVNETPTITDWSYISLK
ncbi:MAG: hypothetical protein HKM24_00790, partial [Gammaproteobacteria bacterium]|nr:hypothetical protein [Gammaproteobacteria bacterium]